MSLMELLGLIKDVLISPEVIGITIAIALYVNIVMYVVSYRKKPPAPRKKKGSAAVAKPDTADGPENDESEE